MPSVYVIAYSINRDNSIDVLTFRRGVRHFNSSSPEIHPDHQCYYPIPIETRRHGQLCFPGGKIETGNTLKDQAFAELSEETGIKFSPEARRSLDFDIVNFRNRFVVLYLKLDFDDLNSLSINISTNIAEARSTAETLRKMLDDELSIFDRAFGEYLKQFVRRGKEIAQLYKDFCLSNNNRCTDQNIQSLKAIRGRLLAVVRNNGKILDDELDGPAIMELDNAVRFFKSQRDSDWYVEALTHLKPDGAQEKTPENEGEGELT